MSMKQKIIGIFFFLAYKFWCGGGGGGDLNSSMGELGGAMEPQGSWQIQLQHFEYYKLIK